MSDLKRKRNVLNVKQKLEFLKKLDNGESASTDAEDVLNEGNAISHSAALQSVETLLDYMGQRGFDYGDITARPKPYVHQEGIGDVESEGRNREQDGTSGETGFNQ
ncbi:hypothetical protein AVEN_45723-1 [Araneus ventricosus]|uniref:Uncharacterized protein n=1 Tax=Araneus ventricosus TaxID=182803 RepID=A0A4Y2KB87_ARAVE|nr:hypothetical protein AVEN_45723-1 [Araneus ventricosus]